MKKAAFFAMLFLAVMVCTTAVTLLSTEKAEAIATYIYCSRQTGASCTNPAFPYYMFVVDRYGQHFVGCCNGLND
jgi:hypothetical protein